MMNPQSRGNTNAMEATWEEYESGDENYDDDLYDAETNKVVVHKLGTSQLKLSGAEEFYKLDSTSFHRIRKETAWRLKAIARNKHFRPPQVRSRSESSNSPFIIIFLKLWAAIMTMGEFLVKNTVKPFIHFTEGISILIKGSRRIVTTFRATSPMRTWVCANTISCSRVQSAEADEENEFYGNSSNVMNSLEKQAMKELRAAMRTALDGNLDNMQITVGNSMAEAQRRGRNRAKVKACPDSGATRSLAGPTFAKRLGCRVIREKINISNASGNSMNYEGTAFFRVFFEDQAIEIPILLSKDIEGRIIIGKYDLIRLHVLPEGFPQVLPARMFRNEHQ